MAPQSRFHYFKCPKCGFDSVQHADYPRSKAYSWCPMCRPGRKISMRRRIARTTDRPEGSDTRIYTWSGDGLEWNGRERVPIT